MDDLATIDDCTLILINIDAFKEINDFYGMKIGDTVIQEVAKALQEIKCEFEYEVYRLYADEFGVLIKKTLNKIQTAHLVKNIEKSIADNQIFTPYKQK